MFAVNDAPLRAQVLDPSGLSDQFRDGQKLRQEYDARQQQKAMAEVMRQPDYDSRITAAQQNKWAGVLVPALQETEYKRKVAEQKYRADDADILKTNAETNKLGSESGKIGLEAQGQGIKNVGESNVLLANSSAGLNKPLLFNTIGQLYKSGVYDEQTTQNLLKLANSDDPDDVSALKQIAMTNPDLAKLFAPQGDNIDGKDANYYVGRDSFTGQPLEAVKTVEYGDSPTAFADRNSRETIATNNNDTQRFGYTTAAETSIANNQLNNDTSRYNNDNNVAQRTDAVDKNTAVSWYNAQTGAAQKDTQLKINQQKANTVDRTAAAKLTNGSNGKPLPPTIQKEVVKHQKNLSISRATITSLSDWNRQLASGELDLSVANNTGNKIGMLTGNESWGKNVAAYANYKAGIMALANAALGLQSGTQTDSDYARMLGAITAGKGLPTNNKVAKALHDRMITELDNNARTDYGAIKTYRANNGQSMPEYGQRQRTVAPTKGNATKPASKSSKVVEVITNDIWGK